MSSPIMHFELIEKSLIETDFLPTSDGSLRSLASGRPRDLGLRRHHITHDT